MGVPSQAIAEAYYRACLDELRAPKAGNVHDFSDGINTVNIILKNKGDRGHAFRWLLVDAFAPVVGVVSTFFFTLPESALGVILAVFSGFFLYIGASDLLPESHHNHPTIWTTVMTVLGLAVLFIAIRIANI